MTEPYGEGAPAPHRDYSRLTTLAFVTGTFAVCLVRLVGFVQANAVNVPCEDQWDFLEPLFEGRSPWSCFFWQHGPHRQGLGGLIDWCLYRATGWDIRAEAWAAVVVLCLATIAAIALAARLRGRLSWSDAAFPLLMLGPIHWETMVYIPNLAHSILPLLCTVLLAYAWGPAGPVARVTGVSILGALALFTGFGSTAAAAAAGLALLVCLRASDKKPQVNRRESALILLASGIALAVFSIGYHWNPATPAWRFPVPNWWDYPRFCALMFASLFGWREISTASVLLGFAMLGSVAATFSATTIKIWRRQAGSRERAVWILTGTSLLYIGLTAVGRLPITLQAAFMWRYATLVIPGVCGLALAVEAPAIPFRTRFRVGFALLWLALAGVVWSDFQPEDNAAVIAKAKNLWVSSYLQTRDLATANHAAGFSVYSGAPTSPTIAKRIHWLDERHLSFFRPFFPIAVSARRLE
jgi:hypothetical protein